MIYLDGLASIIESEYLNEGLSTRVAQCNIFVNPENIRYLVGKVVIISSTEYDSEVNVPVLLKNKCKVISRINTGLEGVSFQPYIMNINKGIQWNGKIIEEQETLNKILDDGWCEFDLSKYCLYFPKVRMDYNNHIGPETTDEEGNLTGYGWVLHQVGININPETPLRNLDILKTGKVLFQ